MAFLGNATAAFFVGIPFFGDPNEDFVHYPDNPSPYIPSERQVVSIIQILCVVCACVFLWIWPICGAAHQLCNTPSSVKNIQSMPYLLSSALKSIGISPQIGHRRISPILGDIKIVCIPNDNFHVRQGLECPQSDSLHGPCLRSKNGKPPESAIHQIASSHPQSVIINNATDIESTGNLCEIPIIDSHPYPSPFRPLSSHEKHFPLFKTSTNPPPDDSTEAQPRPKYLALCIGPIGRLSLLHIKIHDTKGLWEDDEMIFERIRAAYNIQKGWIQRNFSFWRLQRVERVNFRVYHGNLIQILGQYESGQSLGFERLKLLFDHPELGRNSRVYRDRLPLRNDEVKPLPGLGHQQAAGILLLDRPSIFLILVLCGGSILIVVISVVVIWSTIEGDLEAVFIFAAFSALLLNGLALSAIFSQGPLCSANIEQLYCANCPTRSRGWRRFVRTIPSEIRPTREGRQFGSRRISGFLRFIIGTGDVEVYREEIHSFEPPSVGQYRRRPSDIELTTTGTGVLGTDASSAAAMRTDTMSSASSISSVVTPPNSRTMSEDPDSGPPSQQTALEGNPHMQHYLRYLPVIFGTSDRLILSHIEIRFISIDDEDDEKVFKRLRNAYNDRRGFIRRMLSCHAVRKLEQVKFRLHRYNLVKILEERESPNLTSSELIHIFNNPKCGRRDTWYRSRLPLRTQPVRRTDEDHDLPVAVGLRIVEEVSPCKILTLFLGYLFATLLFGIMWWAVKGDIQGAFSAAGYFGLYAAVPSSVMTVAVTCTDR